MAQIYEGFNRDREQDVKMSAKDSFADLADKAPPAPTEDFEKLGQWFRDHIEGGMNERGHKVTGVNQDKFTYGNHEGNFEIDFGRGANAPGGALAWQATPTDDATRQRHPHLGGGPAQAGPAAGPSPSAHSNSQRSPIDLMGPSSDLMTQILESLQAQREPDPQELLLQSLR